MKRIIVTLCLLCSALCCLAQIGPVSVYTTLSAPYYSQLRRYVDEPESRLSVRVHLRDLQVQGGRLRLRMVISNGLIELRTHPEAATTELILNGGDQIRLMAIDLREYLNPEHLIFAGINRDQYLNTGGALPEGMYRIWFEAYESLTGQKVSVNEGFALMRFMDLEAPELLEPKDGHLFKRGERSKLLVRWVHAYHLGSELPRPIRYHLEMVEVPWGIQISADEAFVNYPLKYSETTQAMLYELPVESLALKDGYRYALRVRASAGEAEESDYFKNNGCSRAHFFIPQEACRPLKAPTVEALTSTTVLVSWMPDPDHRQFLLQYRPDGPDSLPWYELETEASEAEIKGLVSGKRYQFRVRAICTSTISQPDLTVYITLPSENMTQACGLAAQAFVSASPEDLAGLNKGDVIDCGGIKITVDEAKGEAGWFSGSGHLCIEAFEYVGLKVDFKNIRINAAYQLVDGEIVLRHNSRSNAQIEY